MQAADITTADVRWDLEFQVKLGATAGRFFAGLRDGVITATRCGGCDWVFVPPQSYCERCLTPADEWLELPPRGVVNAYTVVHIAPGGRKPPFVLATIRIQGADGLLLHHIGGVEIGADGGAVGLKIGDQVEAVWADERHGSILDIRHFEPVGR